VEAALGPALQQINGQAHSRIVGRTEPLTLVLGPDTERPLTVHLPMGMWVLEGDNRGMWDIISGHRDPQALFWSRQPPSPALGVVPRCPGRGFQHSQRHPSGRLQPRSSRTWLVHLAVRAAPPGFCGAVGSRSVAAFAATAASLQGQQGPAQRCSHGGQAAAGLPAKLVQG